MKKMIALVLTLSLATGLTASSVMGNIYGVLDTLDNYASTVQNQWRPNECRGNTWNEYGSADDPYGLGVYYSGIDDEIKPVFDFVDNKYSVDSINGISDLVITKFNPYMVVMSVNGYEYISIQYEVTGKVFQTFNVKYTICIPVEAITDGDFWLGDMSKAMFVMTATSGNTYSLIQRDNDFMGELRLWLVAPHGDKYMFVKETYKENGVNVSVKDWMMQYDH